MHSKSLTEGVKETDIKLAQMVNGRAFMLQGLLLLLHLDGDAQPRWTCNAHGQIQTGSSLSVSLCRDNTGNSLPTELETAFLKYKWRLVTVLIDGTLQPGGAEIDERHMEPEDAGLKTDVRVASQTPHISLINKWGTVHFLKNCSALKGKDASVQISHTFFLWRAESIHQKLI